jgi:uncharacterized repeat protein (TIGR03806 family)
MKLSPWDRPRLWSLAFHPKFSSNGFVYVCYLDQRPRPLRGRISRYTVDLKNPLVCNKDTELILLEWVAPVDHYGGCLKFGPDGMLYCSTGDGAATSDHNNTGQDISDLTSSVIRIDVDRVENGRMYGIPPDNPFVKHPGARGEVWAYGLRNIWKMSFDRKTGELWGGDVGQDLWDMIYLVEKGGNYGWSVMEGSHPFRTDRKVGPTPIIPPVAEHDHAEARSITGGFVYRGSRLPELQGHYIYGDYETGKFFGFRYEGKKMLKPELLADSTVHIVGFGEDDDGELVVLDYSGLLYQLTKAPAEKAAADFPKQLSQTGLYSSVKDHAMAPGVIPYNVNAPLWSDHAIKDRYIALPPGKKINYSANGTWNFPDGTILVKTFAMQMKAGDPSSNKRLETRLMHLESGQWRFYTYLWNEAQTDAELLGKGSLYRDLEISDPAAPGGIRKQKWHFPSRTECTLCHTAISGFALGLSTAQMNRVFNYEATADNQIRTLEHLGLFSKPLSDYYKPSSKPDDPPPSAAKFANPYDAASGTLDDRARSYLHSNCAHCHRIYGGGNALFQLTRWTPLESTATLHAMPTHGDYGITDARIIAPGEPERSMLLFRMSKRGQGRMPHVGSAEPDEAAVKLIREWISSLPKTPKP